MSSTVDFTYMVTNFPALNLQGGDQTVTDLYIKWANCFVDQSIFNECKCEMAVSNLTAHFLVMNGYPSNGLAGSGGGSGPITSEKVGDLSRTYGMSAAAQTKDGLNLGETQYGRLYLKIVSTLSTSPIINTMC
jgi:hypothetical protein